MVCYSGYNNDFECVDHCPKEMNFIGKDDICKSSCDEDDGIYYYKYYDKIGLNSHYAITDREPTFRNQNTYYLADLYLFRKERIE